MVGEHRQLKMSVRENRLDRMLVVLLLGAVLALRLRPDQPLLEG